MKRVGIWVVLSAGLLPGCVHDGDWTVEKALGWDGPEAWKKGKISVASVQVAERVETLGRRIVAQNTFTGLDPLFHTIGVTDPVLFHRGTAEVWISEGLVKKCESDAELAALLCTELGRMMAEKRLARGVGRDREAIPDIVPAGGGPPQGAVASRDRPSERAGVDDSTGPTDPAVLARDLYRGAGFDPAAFDRAAPLLRLSERGEAIRKQMAGPAPVPTWEK